MNKKPPGARRRYLALEVQALQTIREHRMIDPGDHVLVAVSGGADSVALLYCLHRLSSRLQISLTAAHLNHGLRGEESDADEAHVAELCAGLGLRLIREIAPVRRTVAEAGINLEEGAREARYGFLKGAAKRIGATRIAVGHTQNDQAETVLMRFLRGSGIDGLAAIHPVREGIIIRPLLRSPRRSVLRYLDCLGAAHRQDSSNRDLNFRRNRLRHVVIPELKRYFNPRIVETLSRAAAVSRETSNFLNKLARDEYLRLSSVAPECKATSSLMPVPQDHRPALTLDIEGILQLHPALRRLVIREALREIRGSLRGITGRHIDSALDLCTHGKSGRRVELPGEIAAFRQFARLVFTGKARKTDAHFCYELPVPGRCVIPEAGVEMSASLAVQPEKADQKCRIHLDPEIIKHSLTIRSRLPGDRYGGPGHRKVKKMLIDAKVEMGDRGRLPLLAVQGAIVWIPGFPPARDFRAKTQSGQCLVIEMKSVSGNNLLENAARMET